MYPLTDTSTRFRLARYFSDGVCLLNVCVHAQKRNDSLGVLEYSFFNWIFFNGNCVYLKYLLIINCVFLITFFFSLLLFVKCEEMLIGILCMRCDRPQQIHIESHVEGFFECNMSAFRSFFNVSEKQKQYQK